MLQDLRYALRLLAKRPGFTVIAVTTLALGIGANTAIFSVVNAVMLRPLPYKEPDRLISLWESVPERGRSKWRVAPANFFDWKNQNQVFEDMAAFGGSTMTLTGGGEPEQLLGTRASAGYFTVVGVEPVLGRSFLPEEYEPGNDRVVILGQGLWQRRFGSDREIIGKAITLDGIGYTVVGVMPRGIYPMRPTTSGRITFDAGQQEFWAPMTFTAQWAAARGAHVLGVIGRLKPGVTIKQAEADMTAIGARLEQEYAANRGEGIVINPFMDEVIGNVKPALLVLLGAVGFVLLIACANVASLLLAQLAARSKEIAIRRAMGAGRARLVRQFFLENLLLSLLGAGAGVALAVLGVDLIMGIIPEQIPRLDQVSVDFSVLAFTLLLSLATALLFGLAPAWQASKPDVQDTLKEGGRGSGAGAVRQRFRRLLVVSQVGLAVMLVIGAGLLIKSFWRLRQVDPGFKSERVLTLGLSLPQPKYRQPDEINSFFNRLLERFTNLPGMQSAAIAYDHPLEASWIDNFTVEGRPAPGPGETPSANFNPVSWDYFRALGIELISGRQMTAQDDQDHPGVAIVNQAFVRRFFPGEDPLGKRILPGPPPRIWNNQRLTSFEIVGVVRDVKSAGLNAEAEPTYYLPAPQAPIADMEIIVRTEGDPVALIPALREAVWAIDPDQPIANIIPMEKLVAENIAQPRFNMIVMGLFGGVALTLAGVGIYGLLSYSVAQRTHEIGVRMALGARGADVLRLVMGQGLRLTLIGLILGLAGAFAATRVLSGLLFGVSMTDPFIFSVVSVVLSGVALGACFVPARRATRVDPMVALRHE
jgi:putative ABC transport system permease protein